MRRTPSRTSRRGSGTHVRDASLSVRSDAIEMLAVEVEVEVVELLLGARPARCGLGTSECARHRWTTTTTRAREGASDLDDEKRAKFFSQQGRPPSPSSDRARSVARAPSSTDRPPARPSRARRRCASTSSATRRARTMPCVRPPSPPSRTETSPPSPRLARHPAIDVVIARDPHPHDRPAPLRPPAPARADRPRSPLIIPSSPHPLHPDAQSSRA
jgi:hypothetical protein